ncbi:hypothetical protein [Halostagnicola sp. A-GB9-2]|uniref:hypothetical protein n=1 Tax=Halostagnicola sp. A-GB9-2 TaxID=3048066 RepID=UPI0024C0BE50|nr:hypothetical protein [Halostagnicola sp. A-GB9-2]MDJ1431337.1 hypothetical protein [Halostagnicola sp. A-GB9-2]
MAVTLPDSMLARYERFSLYNSPYPAHDGGRAIDLYPGTLRDGRTTDAPSPVSGTVLETKNVRAPSKPYAPEHDHLILLEVDAPTGGGGFGESKAVTETDGEGLVARILHVEPTVEAGDTVSAGDSLGTLVRAGFFAPWVDNHLHVGFRHPEQNHYRASGSLLLKIGPDVELTPLEWDGTGTIVESGDTYAILDSPTHPNPGVAFAGIRIDGGRVLDGGLPHYDGGGVLGGRRALESGRAFESDEPALETSAVSLNGDRLGIASGRTIAWDDVTVTVDGEPITGLSLFCARDATFGAKLICPERSLEVGRTVRVRVHNRD